MIDAESKIIAAFALKLTYQNDDQDWDRDYIAAKIPMMPVIKGIKYTKVQISLYSILLAVVSIFPFATGYLGGFYFIIAIILNVAFIGLATLLIVDKSNRLALPLFLYSIVFLTILFICMALDKLIPIQLWAIIIPSE